MFAGMVHICKKGREYTGCHFFFFTTCILVVVVFLSNAFFATCDT